MARRSDEIKARLLATFRVEAEEHLSALTANLLALSAGLPARQSTEVVEATFREMHTLKGAARSVGLTNVEALCQACESVLSGITQDRVTLTSAVLAGLEEAADGIARLIAEGGDPAGLIRRVEQAVEEPAEPVASPPPAAETAVEPPARGLPPSGTIRLATAKLDSLLFQVEDLLVTKLAAEERVREAKTLAETSTRLCAAIGRAQGDGAAEAARGNGGSLPDLEPDGRAIEASARAALAHLVRDQRRISGAVDGLQDEMRRLRMTPASAVLELFPRMVRDMAAEQGKEVEWTARGADLEVDRRVLEAVKDPLIHLVRNAVAHGIEAPRARAEAGKTPRGRIAVSVRSLEGGRIEILVEDDGCGVNLDSVRAAAARARILGAEEAQALADDQVLELLYRSGLSTSPIITDVSGHGLGLAIVKERVERLEGEVELATRSGLGTTVRLVLPATIAAFRGLLVVVGGRPLLLPVETVERAIRLDPAGVEKVDGQDAIRWNGEPVAVVPLGALLGLPASSGGAEPGGTPPCVIVRSGDEHVGLLVDEVAGDREVLVKELGAPLVRVRNVAGAGLLGTGRVVLILRPADLVKAARHAPRPVLPKAAAEEVRPQSILVVDDSITTRTMEKNLLELAGYRVRVAADGIEAWTLLRSEPCDLVVSDVDMPRMDGFELTERIRADEKLADLPVILVTALESREDKERGIEIGANAYVVKSTFEQSNLLEIIRRLA